MMRQAHLKAVAMDPEDPKPTTLAESAYRRLREDVLCGVIKPGEKIRIDQLNLLGGKGPGAASVGLTKEEEEIPF